MNLIWMSELTSLQGLKLSNSHPKSIDLPDDNPHVMEILCNLLHLRQTAIPRHLSLHELHSLSILVDKYDCSGATKLGFYFWMSQIKPNGPEEITRAIHAAYLFNEPVTFRALTKSLIHEHHWTVDTKLCALGLPSELIRKSNLPRDAVVNC